MPCKDRFLLNKFLKTKLLFFINEVKTKFKPLVIKPQNRNNNFLVVFLVRQLFQSGGQTFFWLGNFFNQVARLTRNTPLTCKKKLRSF